MIIHKNVEKPINGKIQTKTPKLKKVKQYVQL